MTADTTTPGYWLNWRVFLCTVWILISTCLALFLIWKYEGICNSKCQRSKTKEEDAAALYDDEVWRPSLKGVHPAWLLAFRVLAFVVLLALIVDIGYVDGGSIFYFYTQWTFTLVTIYFGLGSILSVYGCFQYHKIQNRILGDMVEVDAEQGACVAHGSRENYDLQPAGLWSYIFQIIFQMNAGAVMLTDCVFWFILLPFLSIKDYDINFLTISMHSINIFFLLGDTALNSLRFPWFRIAYFFLWTIVFVIVQWIVHACIALWWPYPFLDLSSPYAPLWYSTVALLHIPCYGIFVLIIKLKHYLLAKWFPLSYQCPR